MEENLEGGGVADVDVAMKRVSAWMMSLLPALTRQAGSRRGERIDRVEQMSHLLSTLGNALSMVSDMLTNALQDSNPSADLDITYDINVEVPAVPNPSYACSVQGSAGFRVQGSAGFRVQGAHKSQPGPKQTPRACVQSSRIPQC